MDPSLEHCLRIGDYICLYSEEAKGFVYSEDTSVKNNGLKVYTGQNHDALNQISNVHVVSFQVLTQNRYKLTKRYRKLHDEASRSQSSVSDSSLENAKEAAEIEVKDNLTEQRRLLGQPIKYGDIVQLRHVFTSKFLLVSTTETSAVDRNKMLVKLDDYNSKHAQFRIVPRYKVKTEGERVELEDQIVLESVKSIGTFLHVTIQNNNQSITELNCGIEKAVFTVLRHYSPKKKEAAEVLRGGSVVQLFHKDLEAYMAAEGVYPNVYNETAHLRVRKRNEMKMKSFLPPKNCSTYWQVVRGDSAISGESLKWGDKFHLLHLTTRMYLTFDEEGSSEFVPEASERTLFRFYPLLHGPRTPHIHFEGTVRICHQHWDSWINGTSDFTYQRQLNTEGDSLETIQYDQATLLQLKTSQTREYPDAFILQKVTTSEVDLFNYVFGLVPFMREIRDMKHAGHLLTAIESLKITRTFDELQRRLSMKRDDKRDDKEKYNILKHTKMVDSFLEFLHSPISSKDRPHVLKTFKKIYSVLYNIASSNSVSNRLYCARFLPVFRHQLCLNNGVGRLCCQTMMELVRNNRTVIDRILPQHVDDIIELFSQQKESYFFDLLGSLCTSDGIAITENQVQIAETLVRSCKESLCHLIHGKQIGRGNDVYISTDNGEHWTSLAKFVVEEDNHTNVTFFTKQLQLYKKLCFGQNQRALELLTQTSDLFTWETAFHILSKSKVPDSVRALVCQLITGLFFEVDATQSNVSRMQSNNFMFEHISLKALNPEEIEEEVTYDTYHGLKEWVKGFCKSNPRMHSMNADRNIFIKEVLHLMTTLIQLNIVCSQKELQHIRGFVMNYIRDGTRMTGDVNTEVGRTQVQVLLQSLELVDILLAKQFWRRMKFLLGSFKDLQEKIQQSKICQFRRPTLAPLLSDDYDSSGIWDHFTLKVKVGMLLREMSNKADFVGDEVAKTLFALANVEDNTLRRKCLSLLNTYYSSKHDLLRTASRTQVIVSAKSEAIQREALACIPQLRKLAKSKVDDEGFTELCQILDRLLELSHVKGKLDESIIVAQNILINNGILEVILQLSTQVADIKLEERYNMVEVVTTISLTLLRYLCQGNAFVQDWLYDNIIEFLHGVMTSGSQCALAIMEVFKGRPLLCVKISPHVIQSIVDKCRKDQQTAPEWLRLLMSLIKDDSSGIVIKRNQGMIAKSLMEHFSETLYPMELTQEERMNILLQSESGSHKLYYEYLVELLASCAEGENEYIESLCQKLITVSEILTVLNSNDISWETKTIFSKFFVWVYITSAKTLIESGIEELCHDRQIWKHIQLISAFAKESSQNENRGFVGYMQTAGFYVLKGFFTRMYQEEDNQDESEWLVELLEALELFCEPYIQLATSNGDIENMGECLQILISKGGKHAPKKILRKFYNKAKRKKFTKTGQTTGTLKKQDFHELKLNTAFHGFCQHLLYYLDGKNTVGFQRDMISRKYKKMEYTETNIDSSLPLGREFQAFVDSFSSGGQDLNKLNRLIQHLAASYKLWPEKPGHDEEELDIKCLLILQAHLHNVIVLLPENWEEETHKWKKTLAKVKYVQDTLDSFGIVKNILPLMGRTNPMFGKQVLQLTHSLLFNANRKIQESVYKHFLETREEKFFLFVRENLQLALLSVKERRHLTAQKEAKKYAEIRFSEAKAEAENQEDADKENDSTKKVGANNVQNSMMQMKKLGKMVQSGANVLKSGPPGLHQQTVTLEAEFGDDILKDNSTTHTTDVIMSVLGGLCDGQNKQMQEYLRSQPDNLHSIDLIGKVTELLSGIYTHVNQYSIDICTELFGTLHEMCEGNDENKASLLNNKIVDHINFVLRKSDLEDCSVVQVCQLRKAMGRLLYSLIEEQGSDAQNTAKEVCQTIAFDNVKHMMVKCYAIALAHGKEDLFKKKTTLDDIESFDLKTAGIFDGIVKVDQSMDHIIDIGFLYYYIVATMFDIDERLEAKGMSHPMEKDAFQFFKNQCKSVEILKDERLHKKHFRVKNENLLREEVKETLKWEIDRSSPTSKLRDLLLYSKDILKDINYQKSIHRVWIVAVLAKRWDIWNILCVLLSLVINVFMLVTWSASSTTEDIPEEASQIPDNSSINSPKPEIINVTEEEYNIVILILGSIHCFCSCMLLLCYLLLYHPTIPSWFISSCRSFILRAMSGSPFRYEPEENPTQSNTSGASKLEVNLFSAATLYYLTTVAFAVLGTVYYEYFFAFHLFGIVNNNQLLKGVIKAVTLNGRSLLWVGVLGAVVIYVYALVSFGFFRSSISLEDEMFCKTLAECFVSLIRYGTIGDIADRVHLNSLDMSFNTFGWITLFQVTFFIIFTTIGLNIIFGIIVDTFSEIRDTKWIAEKDMRDMCFICSKDSYEFEHHAQGFHHHVKEEHNMWAYVFYFIYLHENEEKEYTSLDMHVANFLKVDALNFFPMNRALSLTYMQDDTVEDQIKDMTVKIRLLQHQHIAQMTVLQSIQKKVDALYPTSGNPGDGRGQNTSRRFQYKPSAGTSQKSHEDNLNISGSHMAHVAMELDHHSDESGENSSITTGDVMATVRLLPTEEESESDLSSADNNLS